jgi:acid phosphatase type 7
LKTLLVVCALALVAAGCRSHMKVVASPEEQAAAQRMLQQSRGLAVLVGAGDIANCDDIAGAEATARLLDKIPGTVFAVGDLVYPTGSASQFADCYDPTWGRHKGRTRPAPGNHESNLVGRLIDGFLSVLGTRPALGNPEWHSDVAPYFQYFGAAAGDPRKGYYSYELA